MIVICLLNNCSHENKVNVIAQNKEKYISFSKGLSMHDYINSNGEVRSIDSLKFLPGSLEKLADSLDETCFLKRKRYFTNPDNFNLMKQKGVFPYSFLDDDIQKLDINRFPAKADFYDKLNGEYISDDEYIRAKSV